VGGWIPLDFLGFSRPNRDFSMGYTDFHGKEFFSFPFPPGPGITGIGDKVLACGSAGLFMAQAYPGF
jgi:hypothetical protein